MGDGHWDDIRLLVAIAEFPSLKAAARSLGTSQATLSRRLDRLEEAVGHVLFERGRGGVRLTSAGAKLLEPARRMQREAHALFGTAQGLTDEPEGFVKVALPPGMAQDIVAPLVPALRHRHPKIRLELVESTDVIDLERSDIDIALRTFRPTSGDLVARKLIDVAIGVYAAPRYVQTLTPGCALADLDWVLWHADMPDFGPNGWLAEQLETPKIALRSNSMLTQRAAVVAGAGAMVTDALQAATANLVRVPVQYRAPPLMPAYLVMHRQRAKAPRVRMVVEFVEATCRRIAATGRVPRSLGDLEASWGP